MMIKSTIKRFEKIKRVPDYFTLLSFNKYLFGFSMWDVNTRLSILTQIIYDVFHKIPCRFSDKS